MARAETIQEFLSRGGKITVLRPDPIPQFISHRTPWHMGGVNNNLKQYTKKSSVGFANRGPCATAPGGRIEPGSPSKSGSNPSWPNRKKTASQPPSCGNGRG